MVVVHNYWGRGHIQLGALYGPHIFVIDGELKNKYLSFNQTRQINMLKKI
jgi:hypothetical protein